MMMSKEQFSKLISSATQAGEIEGIKGFLSRLISDLSDVLKVYEERRLNIDEKDFPNFEDWKDAENNPPDTARKVLITYKNGLMDFGAFIGNEWTTFGPEDSKVALWCEIPKLPKDILEQESNKVNSNE